LEEKKLQNQKLQQRNNNRNDVQSKQAAIAFLNRKKRRDKISHGKRSERIIRTKAKKATRTQTGNFKCI